MSSTRGGTAEGACDFSEVATSTLLRLRDSIAGGRLRAPLNRAVLVNEGVQAALDTLLQALGGRDEGCCLAILDIALAERLRGGRSGPELVWTGPERSNATARDTAVVLRALFEGAQEQVVLAGYDFTRGASLLEPLWRAITERSVDARFFVNVNQTETAQMSPDEYVGECLRATLGAAWPFGAPYPRVYYDPRATVPGPPYSSLHAKCVVVDGRHALVTSANFTLRAQERNIECGVLLDDTVFAHHLARQWLGLIDAGLVREARVWEEVDREGA